MRTNYNERILKLFPPPIKILKIMPERNSLNRELIQITVSYIIDNNEVITIHNIYN